MLTTLKNNRSLTFYQQSTIAFQSKISTSYAGGIGATAIAGTSFQTAATTTGYNIQLQKYLTELNQKRALDASSLDLSKPDSTARNRGIQRAWEYESAEIKMGGKGTANWTDEQRAEIREIGKARGAEGHHQKNVADHPEQQADPDNIKFYKDRQTHLDEGHGGDWHNKSDGDTIDRNKRLTDTNAKRVWKNELRGLGIAVAIGAGIGLTIGFITTLAQSGVTPDSLRIAAAEGVRAGVESGSLAAVSYGIGRTLGEVATKAITGAMGNLGIGIGENIVKMVNMGVVGTMTTIVFSVYQFIKLKLNGVETREALIQVGKQALFSMSLLAVSIAAQGIWGGAAGIIVSISIGILLIIYSAGDAIHQRHIAEEIRIYTVNECYPVFA